MNAGREPFVREAGAGPGVVCLHANASTSSQWRALMDLLAPTFRVLAPDLYGAGKSPEWPSDRSLSLHDEAAFIEPVVARAQPPVALVGHSYGAAVALVTALIAPIRIRALVLYEPTLFSVLDQVTPPPNEADGIRTVVREASRAVEAGDHDAAARRFIDYWMGAGSWEQMPEQRKVPIAASIANIGRWGHALLTAPTPVEAIRSLQVPVLYLVGKSTPSAAGGVARILTSTLPNVEVVEFEGLGHMGPVTHPEVVNPVIAGFLWRAADG